RAELTASGQILGTPSYMSPEQAAGKQNLVGPSTDIYSLGAILYACLTGRAPFVADSPVDTLLHVMNQEPLSPRVLNPSVPKDLETICLKCLQKEPHKRYGTAEELSEDLQRFLEGRPVMARPISVINKSISWCRRNKTIASLLMLLFTSMAIGTLIASKFAVDARQHAKDEQLQRLQAEAAQHAAEQAHKEAERAKSDVLRSLYIARIYLTRLLWDRGNKWGASLPHLQQFFKNDLMIADPDPKIELQTLNQMITANPSDDFLHFLRGIYYAKRRQWQESIADLELSSNLISQQYWYHCEAASVALMVDDYETYDYHVQSLLKYLKEFEKEGEILSGANISLIATLRPQSPEVLSRLLPFTKSWSSSQSNQFYRMKSLILVRLRMGEYVTVLKLLEPFQAELSFRRKEHEVLAGSIRALAFYHLGHINEAKQILHLAQKTYDDQLTKGFEVSNGSLQDTHHPFIQAHILLNEAKLNIENNQTNVNGGDVPNQFDLQEQIQELMRKLHLIQQSELLLLKENPFFSQGHRAVENDFERTHFDVTEFEATSQVNIQLVQNQLDSKDETVRIKALEKLVALK
ncbi:serine/threonine-protein kinase, partial [uncultured Rubinisphaera sp.]|uniref:serine/threonine protein kinase n=1 Tax=uncultured Rubinisphaera sp. TaxID=1678686 RepID=UPI0030DC8460